MGQSLHLPAPGSHNTDFDLLSTGKDGREGTDDDITSWEQFEPGSRWARRQPWVHRAELMVVMVIMVLLAGLAAPRFVGSMRSERLRTGGRVVLLHVQLVRSRGSEGRLTRLDFDYDQGRITALRYVQDTQGE